MLLCAAVVVALGGVDATLHVSAVRAPLLALPPLVMLLFYLRGLYRTRLRALVLDGIVPVLSGVSVAAMAVATLGMLLNGTCPARATGCAPGCSRWSASALGRIVLSFAQRWARKRRLVGKSVLIMGAGVVGAQVARRLESHPEYGLVPDRLPRRGPALGGRGRRARRAGARHDRGSRRDRRAHGRAGT